MADNEYNIVDSFKVGNGTVIVLDRDFESFEKNTIIIDNSRFLYALNSSRRGIYVEKDLSPRNKLISFV